MFGVISKLIGQQFKKYLKLTNGILYYWSVTEEVCDIDSDWSKLMQSR